MYMHTPITLATLTTVSLLFSHDDGLQVKHALLKLVARHSPLLHASVFVGTNPEMVRMRLSLHGVRPLTKLMSDPAVLGGLQVDLDSTDVTVEAFLTRTVLTWEEAIQAAALKAARLQGASSLADRKARAAELMCRSDDSN